MKNESYKRKKSYKKQDQKSPQERTKHPSQADYARIAQEIRNKKGQ